MKKILKILVGGILSTISFLLLVVLITYFVEFPLWQNLTYPFRVVRGSERFVGETLNAEVAYIWSKIILPIIFFLSLLFWFFAPKWFHRNRRK